MRAKVVAAVIQDQQGRYLLTQRPAGRVRAGAWEFPGGKLRPAETAHQALCRELQEELGMAVLASAPLHTIKHQYPDCCIELIAMQILRWQHEPQPLELQQIRWLTAAELSSYDLCAADLRLLRVLRLPALMYITPALNLPAMEHHAATAGQVRERRVAGTIAALNTAESSLLRLLQQALTVGAGMVYFRQRQLSIAAAWPLLQETIMQCRIHGVGVLTTIEACQHAHARGALVADGIHLSSAELMAPDAANRIAACKDIAAGLLVGASCHHLAELRQAEGLACDYVVLGPVKRTPSHPLAKPLGWQQLQQLTFACDLPVYALGGMAPQDLDQARAHGAYGVAGISQFRI